MSVQLPDVLNQLRIQGGSPGGARPKVTVALADDGQTCQSGFGPLPEGYHHWLAKFRAQDDPPDMGRIEQVYTVMARLAGVETAESRLIPVCIERRTEALFAARRFDRNSHDKRHVLTLSGYLYASHRYPSVGYNRHFRHTILAGGGGRPNFANPVRDHFDPVIVRQTRHLL